MRPIGFEQTINTRGDRTMQITVRLDEMDWGQIVDGLVCRTEWYENAVQYYETGFCEGEVAEVRDREEARALADWHRKISEEIRAQIRVQANATTDRPMWSDMPFGHYLEAVDYALDVLGSSESTQEDMNFIAGMQDENNDPLETAFVIFRGGKCRCGVCPTPTCPDKSGGAGPASNFPF